MVPRRHGYTDNSVAVGQDHLSSFPPRLKPITDILTATENIVRSACHEDELKALEAWLRSLLAEVVDRLADDFNCETPQPCLPSNGSIGVASSLPASSADALEDWYTDPLGAKKWNRSPAVRAARRDAMRAAEVFSLEQPDLDIPSQATEAPSAESQEAASREGAPLCSSPKEQPKTARKSSKEVAFHGKLSKEVESDQSCIGKEDGMIAAHNISKDTVLKILSDIIVSVQEMKIHIREITSELVNNKLSFDQTYQRIKAVEPEDILEKYGLSMTDFDKLLHVYGVDPQIKEGVRQITGVHYASLAAEKDSVLPISKVIDIHEFMLKELGGLLGDLDALKETAAKDHYNNKIVLLVVQAIMDARLEEKFSLKSEDIENAVVRHHDQLTMDQKFANIIKEIHGCMNKLMQ